MRYEELAQWLLDNADPIIRFRTLVDLLGETDVGVVAHVLNEMTESSEVTRWLEYLKPRLQFNEVHSGRFDSFENVMGKLVQLGIRAGLQPFDSLTLPFRVWLSENVGRPVFLPHSVFHRTIVASFLALAGYDSVDAVEKQLSSRLHAVHEFMRDPDFDSVFAEKSESSQADRESYLSAHRLVRPELYPDQQMQLPWIHDIRGFAYLRSIMDRAPMRDMAEEIVRNVLTDGYHAIPWSYGLAEYGKNYYVIGWAAHVPGYSSRPEGRLFGEMLLTMEMLAPFRCVQTSDWFREMMVYLEQFRTPLGTYSFPRAWLPERKLGYWVSGERMGFDSRQGHRTAIECESTFRVLMILRRAGKLG